MRDEYCSLVAEPIESFIATERQFRASSHRPIPLYSSNADERDQVMENLQKLFDTHQQRRVLDLNNLDQPGCSTSSSRIVHENYSDQTSSYNGSNNGMGKINIPLLLPSDVRSAILKTTVVSGQILACFVTGGECRLCFPQMRALCLGDIPTHKIDETMKALAIVNPHASEEQLIELKKSHIVPAYLAKCELITKTNAERLISVMQFNGIPRPTEMQNDEVRRRLHSLHIAHDCFGGCRGLLYPAMVPNPCLECCTCHFMFKPEDFCRHTHQPVTDKNTCFWGFDTSNWPYYIRIDDEAVIPDGFAQNGADAENQLANFIQNYPNHPAQRQQTTSLG